MMFSNLFTSIFGNSGSTPDDLYSAIVAQSRQTGFYTHYNINDDVTGRFDMLCLHLSIVLTRLQPSNKQGERFNQYLIDLFFADMDRSLRELGVGDLSVGKKVRKMSEVFYGLGTVMEPILIKSRDEENNDHSALEDVMRRNFYTDKQIDKASALGAYVAKQFDHLSTQETAQIIEGKLSFLELNEV